MQFSVVALFIGAALATPTTLSAKLAARDSVCGGTLYGTPTCCGLDVLGLIDVNCKNPKSVNDSGDFKKSCGEAGGNAMCCTLGLADLELLCTPPV